MNHPSTTTRQLANSSRGLSRIPPQDLSLPVIARHAAMSIRTLSRHFRAQVGTTPANWIARARVRRAQALVGNDTVGSRASGRRIRVWISGRNAPALRRNCRNDSTCLPTRILAPGQKSIPGAYSSEGLSFGAFLDREMSRNRILGFEVVLIAFRSSQVVRSASATSTRQSSHQAQVR